MKRVKNAKFCAIIIVLLLLAFVFTPYASSALVSSVTIGSQGRITTDVYAASGYPNDIQAAVNQVAAAGGGTVQVPAGIFYWNGETVNIPSGVNVIGASPAGCKGHEDGWESYTATTILHNNDAPTASHAYASMFYISGGHKPTRIANIQFEATPPSSAANENPNCGAAIIMRQVYDFRIDHCTFINFCNTAVACTANDGNNPVATCYGVIDHCVCTNPYKLTVGSEDWLWGYGFYSIGNVRYDDENTVHAGSSAWNPDITNYYGQYGAVAGSTIMYIEDCHMSLNRHAFDAIQGGFYCARYNLIDYPACEYTAGSIDAHGTTAGWASNRGMEVYNNTVYGAANNKTPWNTNYYSLAVQLRDGSALVYANNFICDTNSAYNYFINLQNDDTGNVLPFTHVSSTYIWSNSYVNCSGFGNSGGYTENVNYFLRAPNQAQDGFTYTPYVYPNPRTTQP